jgi:hypothetical protein
MNVAIFTDNDFDKVNGVTTTFKAALKSAPAGIPACGRVRFGRSSREHGGRAYRQGLPS